MKKLVSIFVTVAMILALAGCGASPSPESADAGSSSSALSQEDMDALQKENEELKEKLEKLEQEKAETEKKEQEASFGSKAEKPESSASKAPTVPAESSKPATPPPAENKKPAEQKKEEKAWNRANFDPRTGACTAPFLISMDGFGNIKNDKGEVIGYIDDDITEETVRYENYYPSEPLPPRTTPLDDFDQYGDMSGPGETGGTENIKPEEDMSRFYVDDYFDGKEKSEGTGIHLRDEFKDEPDTSEMSEDELAMEVVRLANEERENAGLSAVPVDDTLMEVAQMRANELTEKFSHERPNGEMDQYCALPTYSWVMCNAQKGRNTPAGAVEAWMNSREHKRNMLYGEHDMVGAGHAESNGTDYWIIIFATEDGRYPNY